MTEGHDLVYQDLVSAASPECEAEPLDAEDTLYLLYTSGTDVMNIAGHRISKGG